LNGLVKTDWINEEQIAQISPYCGQKQREET